MLRDVVRRRWAHAPVIHAASHFYHDKVSISMHACDPVPILSYGAPLGGHFGPPELRYESQLCHTTKVADCRPVPIALVKCREVAHWNELNFDKHSRNPHKLKFSMKSLTSSCLITICAVNLYFSQKMPLKQNLLEVAGTAKIMLLKICRAQLIQAKLTVISISPLPSSSFQKLLVIDTNFCIIHDKYTAFRFSVRLLSLHPCCLRC